MNASLPAGLRGALLDLDGTLTDTEPMHHRSTNIVLAEHGAFLSEAEYAPCIGISEAAFWERLKAAFGIARPWRELADARTDAFVELTGRERVPLKPGVDALFDALAARDLPAVIASAAPSAQIHATLKSAGLLARVAGICSAHDDVEHSKPAPDVYRAAAARIGVPTRTCLAVEDSPSGARSAKASGAFVVVVPDALVDRDGVAPFADLLADSLHDVAVLVERAP